MKQPEAESANRQILGLNLSGLTDEARRRCNIKESVKNGVVVTKVDPNSTAADKRIQPGEVIVEVGQEAVANPADVTKRVEALKKEGDEMVHVASEMEREGMEMPLLIGGATTSRVHTAVKIHPAYERGQAVYVTDASRAVGVVSSLISKESRGATIERVRAEYAKVADAHRRSEADKQRLPLAKARANAFKVDWSGYAPKKPSFTGTRTYGSYEVADLVPYIDWTPFLQTYEFKGRYPAILDDPEQGPAARALFEDAQVMLKQIVEERLRKDATHPQRSCNLRHALRPTADAGTHAPAHAGQYGPLWRDWLTSVDHKKIGIMYVVLALVMLLRGFADALLMPPSTAARRR